MINTNCKFYYGHTVTDENNTINFEESIGVEKTAIMDIGEYTLMDFFTEMVRTLNEAGANTYDVSVDRVTRIPTITVTGGSCKFLPVTGTNAGTSALPLAGFTVDTAFAASLVGDSASGLEWVPQFLPQSFVDFEQHQKAIDGVVRKTQSGKVEAVRFGVEKIAEMNFTFITNIIQPDDGPITSSATGYDDALAFMEYAVTKADLEFIPDENDPYTFTKCILESTPEDQNGLSFMMRELYDKGIPSYFETGVLKFRKI
jgi:hypothetical protein